MDRDSEFWGAVDVSHCILAGVGLFVCFVIQQWGRMDRQWSIWFSFSQPTKLWLWTLLTVCRIGEASHPGPTDFSWQLGLMNPTGLQGKELLLNNVGSGIFGVTETHLSTHGIQKVRRSLKFARSPFTSLLHGYPAPSPLPGGGQT